MDWVKHPLDYYLRLEHVSDGAEVMFTRGLSLAGEMETDGFLHAAVLHWLTRHHRRVDRYAAELVAASLWLPATNGFQVTDWDIYVAPLLRTERAHIPNAVRIAIYQRDGWACVRCAATEPLSLDHIWPWSRGGSDDPDNLQTLCMPCNMRKGARV